MPERRNNRTKREAFDKAWTDLLGRLRRVCGDFAPEELEELTRRITRFRFRWETRTAVPRRHA